MLKEFKECAMRGNAGGIAVGIIILRGIWKDWEVHGF